MDHEVQSGDTYCPGCCWHSSQGSLAVLGCNEAAVLSVSPRVTLSNPNQLGCGDLMLGSGLLEPVSHAVCHCQCSLMLCSVFADGGAGDPGERGVILRAAGGHQQCHPAAGGPPAAGEPGAWCPPGPQCHCLLSHAGFVFRSSFRSVWSRTLAGAPRRGSSCSTRRCLRCRR